LNSVHTLISCFSEIRLNIIISSKPSFITCSNSFLYSWFPSCSPHNRWFDHRTFHTAKSSRYEVPLYAVLSNLVTKCFQFIPSKILAWIFYYWMGKRKCFARSEVLTVATMGKQGVLRRTDILLSFHYKTGVGLGTDRIKTPYPTVCLFTEPLPTNVRHFWLHYSGFQTSCHIVPSLRLPSNSRCCEVGVTDGTDLRSTSLRWAQVFHRD
jgi:hypothetical protein